MNRSNEEKEELLNKCLELFNESPSVKRVARTLGIAWKTANDYKRILEGRGLLNDDINIKPKSDLTERLKQYYQILKLAEDLRNSVISELQQVKGWDQL